jgi:hypothetical protein
MSICNCPTGSIADIVASLAAMPEQELHALRANLDSESIIVPGLLSWLEAAINWEITRRAGACHELLSPRTAVIRESEVECSLVALAFLQAQLRHLTGAARFLDVTANALCVINAIESSRGVH